MAGIGEVVPLSCLFGVQRATGSGSFSGQIRGEESASSERFSVFMSAKPWNTAVGAHYAGVQDLTTYSFISSIEMHECLSSLTCLIVTELYAARMHRVVLSSVQYSKCNTLQGSIRRGEPLRQKPKLGFSFSGQSPMHSNLLHTAICHEPFISPH